MALTKRYADRIEGTTSAKDIKALEDVLVSIRKQMLAEGFEISDFNEYVAHKAAQLNRREYMKNLDRIA